jgi:hypothetical protein
LSSRYDPAREEAVPPQPAAPASESAALEVREKVLALAAKSASLGRPSVLPTQAPVQVLQVGVEVVEVDAEDEEKGVEVVEGEEALVMVPRQ